MTAEALFSWGEISPLLTCHWYILFCNETYLFYYDIRKYWLCVRNDYSNAASHEEKCRRADIPVCNEVIYSIDVKLVIYSY